MRISIVWFRQVFCKIESSSILSGCALRYPHLALEHGNEAFSANRGGMPPLAEPDARPHAARLAAALAGPPQAMETGPRPAVTIEDAGGIDPTPLIDQLRAGDFEAADQTTRDLLIEIAGADATKRGYVYWTEARTLDAAALGAVENLWLHYSDGKFGHPATIIGTERELVATFPADRHPATPAACKVLSPDKSPPSFRTAWMIDIRNNPLGGSRGLVQGRDFLQALHVIHLLSEALLGIVPQVSPRHRSVLPLSILPQETKFSLARTLEVCNLDRMLALDQLHASFLEKSQAPRRASRRGRVLRRVFSRTGKPPQ